MVSNHELEVMKLMAMRLSGACLSIADTLEYDGADALSDIKINADAIIEDLEALVILLKLL